MTTAHVLSSIQDPAVGGPTGESQRLGLSTPV